MVFVAGRKRRRTQRPHLPQSERAVSSSVGAVCPPSTAAGRARCCARVPLLRRMHRGGKQDCTATTCARQNPAGDWSRGAHPLCNARNHASSCRCGWGEGQGAGGYGGGRGTRTRTARFTPSWSGTRAPSTVESYTNPNASCPVCGAAVFFYRSPNGGRVFFDQLGIPWPKHPCTDASFHWRFGQVKLRTGQRPLADLASSRATLAAEAATPRHAWRPLILLAQDKLVEGTTRVRLRDTAVPGCLYLPDRFVGQPAVWRWSVAAPGYVEVSTFALTDAGQLSQQLETQPGCLLHDEDWYRHQQGGQEWTAQQLVALGLAAAGGVGVGADAGRDYVLAHRLLWQAMLLGQPSLQHLIVLDNVTKSLLGINDQSPVAELQARLRLRSASAPPT